MVRKILSDLISGVRTGIAWGLCYTPPKSRLWHLLGDVSPRRTSSRVWSELPHVGRGRVSEVVARARTEKDL